MGRALQNNVRALDPSASDLIFVDPCTPTVPGRKCDEDYIDRPIFLFRAAEIGHIKVNPGSLAICDL